MKHNVSRLLLLLAFTYNTAVQPMEYFHKGCSLVRYVIFPGLPAAVTALLTAVELGAKADINDTLKGASDTAITKCTLAVTNIVREELSALGVENSQDVNVFLWKEPNYDRSFFTSKNIILPTPLPNDPDELRALVGHQTAHLKHNCESKIFGLLGLISTLGILYEYLCWSNTAQPSLTDSATGIAGSCTKLLATIFMVTAYMRSCEQKADEEGIRNDPVVLKAAAKLFETEHNKAIKNIESGNASLDDRFNTNPIYNRFSGGPLYIKRAIRLRERAQTLESASNKKS